MSEEKKMSQAEVMHQAALARHDYRALKLEMKRRGFSALLVREPHTPIKITCRAKPKSNNGYGHEFTASPVQALNEGCPTCNLLDEIANDPKPVVSFKDWEAGVNKQRKQINAMLEAARRKLRHRRPSASDNYWLIN